MKKLLCLPVTAGNGDLLCLVAINGHNMLSPCASTVHCKWKNSVNAIFYMEKKKKQNKQESISHSLVSVAECRLAQRDLQLFLSFL